MAYCTLQEAWGQDYKSFLSPASLSPDWLQNSESPQDPTTPTRPTTNNIEQFEGSSHDDNGDHDLMLDHDEFNLPFQYEIQGVPHAPQGNNSDMDDYYKLIDTQYAPTQSYQVPFEDTNYAEELQLNNITDINPINPKKCHQTDKVKHHLQKCKNCRQKMKDWLRAFEENVDSDNSKNTFVKDAIALPSKIRAHTDLIFYIAVGIFIIFILDMFVRLGGLGGSRDRRRR